MRKLPFDKIRSLFTTKRAPKEGERPLKVHAMHLDLLLLSAALKNIQKGNSKKPLSLFTAKILSSKSKHLEALVRHAEQASSKGDIELLSYKEFFSRNQLALYRAVQWKLSKYLRTPKELTALIRKMQNSTPINFQSHLITLLKEEGLSANALTCEARRLEEDYRTYQNSFASNIHITPI